MDTPTEEALTSTSLSASVMDNPPSAPPSSSASPPSERSKIVSGDVEGTTDMRQELKQKKIELVRKQEALKAEHENYVKQKEEHDQMFRQRHETSKREQGNVEPKKVLELTHQAITVELLNNREYDSLLSRKIDLIEEEAAINYASYGGENEEDEKMSLIFQEQKQKHLKMLSTTLGNICTLEEQLDVINKKMNDCDEGTSIITIFTAHPDPNQPYLDAVDTPTVDALTSTSVLTSATENASPSAPPSSSTSSPSEHQQVTSRVVKEDTDRRFELTKKEIELMHKRDVLLAECNLYWKRSDERNQKINELEETLEWERETHENKRNELKTEAEDKQMKREVWKQNDAILQRIFRKKELEIGHEVTMIQLSNNREHDSLLSRDIDLIEEEEAFYREKYGGGNEEDERKLQKALNVSRKEKKENQQLILETRKEIRELEDEEILYSKNLDAINQEMEGHDEGTVIATTSDSFDISTECAPTAEMSLSASVTNNPPSAPPSYSVPPPSERQKVSSRDVEGGTKGRFAVSQKELELIRKRKALDVEFAHFEKQKSEMERKTRGIEETLKREHKNYELKIVEIKKEVSSKEVWERETAKLERIFRKKTLELNEGAIVIQLLHLREAERLYVLDVGILEEFEVYYRENAAGGNEEDEKVSQENFEFCREQKEDYQKVLPGVREDIHALEKEAIFKKQALEEVNKEIGMYSDDEGTTTATIFTAHSDPNQPYSCAVDTPTEHAPTADTSLSASVTDNPPSAPPSSSSSPPSERHKAVSGDVEEEMNDRQELTQEARDWDLVRKKEALAAKVVLYEEQKTDLEQKTREFKASLRRERETHEIKRNELKTEAEDKQTKREVWKQNDANLQRIFQKKKVELEQEEFLRQLSFQQTTESLLLFNIDYLEDSEASYRKKYVDNESSLQQALSIPRAKIENHRKSLVLVRENIRTLQEDEMYNNRLLDAINKEIEGNGEGIAIVIMPRVPYHELTNRTYLTLTNPD